MTREELIKILEDYEIFDDDDFGGSYKSIMVRKQYYVWNKGYKVLNFLHDNTRIWPNILF